MNSMVLNKLKSAISKVEQKVDKKSEQQPSRLVALDIGTEYVKALIAKVEGEAISIIGMSRVHQKLSDMHSGAIADIAAVVKNCDQALSEAEKMAQNTSRRVVIGIAGELVKGSTTTIKYQRQNAEKRLDMNELEAILEQVQERAFERAKGQLIWESGNPELEVRMVNSALVSVHIDGYKVTNPIGFQGKEVAIQLYAAFAPMVHIGAFERVAEELDMVLLSVPAQPFAVARSVLSSDANSNFSAILIDVGGGTTDIAVVNEGGVEGTKMFGIGGRSFTQAISLRHGIDFEKAEELKLKASSKELSESIQKKVEKSLERTIHVWLSGVELALQEFKSLDHLPSKILLCGGGSSLTQLVEELREGDWYRSLPFTRKPVVEHISPEDVINITDETGKVNDHTFVTAMGMLRIGHDAMLTSGKQSDSIRDTMNRLLQI